MWTRPAATHIPGLSSTSKRIQEGTACHSGQRSTLTKYPHFLPWCIFIILSHSQLWPCFLLPPSASLRQVFFFFSCKKTAFRPLLCSYRNKGRHLWASFCPSFPLYSPEFLRHACASAGALFCISVLIIPCLINTLQAGSMHLSLHAWVRDWRTGWVNVWMAGW